MWIKILSWLLFGATIGIWAAYRTHSELSALIVLGVVGAVVGGALGQIASSGRLRLDIILPALVAIGGAALLIGLYANLNPDRNS